jgi:hypothetical protein
LEVSEIHHVVPTIDHRSLTAPEEDDVLIMPLTFQICISVVLGIIILAQLFLTTSLVLQREKRVFEFAQPQALCVFLASSVVATAGCYLFIYISNFGCVIRDPIIFLSISIMGATVTGRAWRISSLMNNPLMKMGRNEENNSASSCIEKARLALLQALTVLSRCKCDCVGNRNAPNSPFRIQISVGKMMIVTAILTTPQLIWQILVLSIPYTRPKQELILVEMFEYEMRRRECASQAQGAWPFWISVLFAALPLCCAYLLNMRPRRELDQLPSAVDERLQLQSSFRVFVQSLFMAVPVFYMAVTPHVKAYSGIVLILSLTLPLCYHIVYLKLRYMEGAPNKLRLISSINTDSDTDKTSVAHATRMVEMYERIGQNEKCISVIDETLSSFIKNKGNALGIGHSKDKEKGWAGFTKGDLEGIDADYLKLIINLLHTKGQVLIRTNDFLLGQELCAKINVDTIAIYENCPAARDLDSTIMFPVYSICSAQLKAGMIEDDDKRTLQRDLADRFAHEANLEAYHFARALAMQAEIRGSLGGFTEALSIFEKMRMIYLPDVHPKLLTKTYAQDRCAQCFAYSAVWLMQLGKIREAIERCELVMTDLVPKYDKKDVLGILNVFIPIIRVLKWHGGINRARAVFEQYMPEAPEHRLGKMRRAMLLLLSLCSDDSGASSYNVDNLESDIALVLELDFPDMFDGVFTSICWSMKSFVAELCLELARRLEPCCSARYELIQKGIRCSLVADERVRGQNKKVKHIVAHKSHQAVYADLFTLASSDASLNVDTIYGNGNGGTEDGTESLGSSSNGNKIELAKRLVVKSRNIAQGGVNGNKNTSISSTKSKKTNYGDENRIESFGSSTNDTKMISIPQSEGEVVEKKVSFSHASNGSRSKNKMSELSASFTSQASNGSAHGSTQLYSNTEDSPTR